jgi:Leucine-rich repeat (LRR) protein
LDLSHNKLTTVPKEMGNLKLLGYLHLNNNQLTSLPEEIGYLEDLDLHLNNNNLTSLPEEIADVARWNHFDAAFMKGLDFNKAAKTKKKRLESKLDGEQQSRFVEILKKTRKLFLNVNPKFKTYHLITNEKIVKVAKLCPTNKYELSQIEGIGNRLHLFETMLQAIRKFLAEVLPGTMNAEKRNRIDVRL